MKSAYELAMERLNQAAPTKKVTAEQKRQLAELDSLYMAKIAQREISLRGEQEKARAAGDGEAFEKWQKQLAADRAALTAELEAKKEKVRQGK